MTFEGTVNFNESSFAAVSKMTKGTQIDLSSHREQHHTTVTDSHVQFGFSPTLVSNAAVIADKQLPLE